MRTPIVAVTLLLACSGPSKAPTGPGAPASLPPAGPDDPPAAPPVEADAKPDTPTGSAAKRDGELAAKVTSYIDAFVNTEPAFTRDGKRVVFVSNRDGLPQLYISGTNPT